MILVDLSNIFYRSLFFMENQIKDEVEKYGISNFEINTQTLLQSMMKEIRYREDQFTKDYGRLILCADSRKNWRKDYFKFYKQARKISKDNDERDWEQLFRYFDEAKKIIADNSYYIVLEVDELEADDIIALCCKKSKEKIVIVSLDKDLNQLIDNKRIKQYSPMKQEFIKNEDKHSLKEAILTGDSGDGVPNIFSDDDHYVKENKVRAKPITSKIKEYFHGIENIMEEDIRSMVKILNESNKKGEVIDEEYVVNNFNRNKTMIDLEMVPKKYETIFGQNLKLAISKSNTNKDKHESWVDSIINNNKTDDSDDESDIDIGDLFE